MSTKAFLDAHAKGIWDRYAATKLGPGAFATWDPLLPREPRFLTPIDVQALVVPRGGTLDVLPTVTVLPTAEGAWPEPAAAFSDARRTLGEGVHLHWAMPDGLTHGDAGRARSGLTPAGNPMGLPALPDRFVIVRMTHGRADRRAWILEADAGEHHDLAGWTDPAPRPASFTGGPRAYFARDRLNAMSGGDPAWAATYDAVLDRFAFHDTLDDLTADLRAHGRFTYLVAGWWSDPDLDPFAGTYGLSQYAERAHALGWTAPGTEALAEATAAGAAAALVREAHGAESGARSTGKAPLVGGRAIEASPAILAALEIAPEMRAINLPASPHQTILHGTVFGVAADGVGPDLRPPASAIELAIGGSNFGALAALLADGTDEARLSSERILTAFSANLLTTIDAPGGLAQVDEERHAASFTALPGGQRAKPDRVATGERIAVTPGRGAAPATTATAARTETLVGAGGGDVTRRIDAAARATEAARVIPNTTIRAVLDRKAGYTVSKAAFDKRGVPPRARVPFGYRDVAAPLPRFFVPNDPVFMLRGAGRSLRHGGDARFEDDELLACRLGTDIVDDYRGILARDGLPYLLQSCDSGAIPLEIDRLLSEAVLTDPYRTGELVHWAHRRTGLPEAPLARRIEAEMILRNATPVGRAGTGIIPPAARDELLKASVMSGTDASPIGRTRWAQAWVPLWCEVELRYAVDAAIEAWTLGAIDLEPTTLPTGERTLTCHVLLTGSSARALAGHVHKWLDEEDQRDSVGKGEIDEETEAILAAAAEDARWLDVLHGAFEGLRATLLGLDPRRHGMMRIDADGRPLGTPPVVTLPALLAGGHAWVTRLRIVDAFGRWLDAPQSALTQAEIASTHLHPQGGGRILLRPRLTAPSRLWFRFVDAAATAEIDATIDQEDPSRAHNPIAGWLLPDHVDEALELFDREGTPIGQLMHDPLTGAVVWEGAPGTPGPLGTPPDPGDSSAAIHLVRFAADVIRADAEARKLDPAPHESALSALLRAIDTTSWTIDPLGALGTGPIAGLVGRPIAMVRATLRVDVPSDSLGLTFAGDDPAALRVERDRAFAELAARQISVRLGELTRTDDGLLGYLPDGADRRLHVVAPEVRSNARSRAHFASRGGPPPESLPIDHPYLSTDSQVVLHSNHTVTLSLLLAPGSRVYATSGVFPRKSLALARDWTHPWIERLSPSFRVGPVLVEPGVVRMPKVTGLGPKQGFIRKKTPLSWLEDPITAATKTAYLPDDPHGLEEGWIRVRSADEEDAP